MFPVGTTFAVGELTDPEPEKIRWWEPHDRERVWPALKFRAVDGELSTESSPEWLFGLESDFLGMYGLGPAEVRPETDPDELELLLVVVAACPLSGRVRSGETGDPISSSRKSGLLTLTPLSSLMLVNVFLSPSESASNPSSDVIFPEYDDILRRAPTPSLFLSLSLSI